MQAFYWLISNNPDSLERLAAIFRHPVISQYVMSLFYEPDALLFYESRKDGVIAPGSSIEVPIRPDRGASERDFRAYYRACSKYTQDPRHKLRRLRMDHGYVEYRRLFPAQEQLQSPEYGLSAISDAFSRLPELCSIVTPIHLGPGPSTLYLIKEFKVRLQCPNGDLAQSLPARAPRLYSLLLASHDAGRQLTSLVIRDIDWRCLQDVPKCKDVQKESLRQIRILDLSISIGNEFDENENGPEILACREYLANNAICDFIKAAPHLESLSVMLWTNTAAYVTKLKNIVDDHYWPKLKSITFAMIDATYADLASFCTRHAATLKHLGLHAIRLLEQGEWPPTMEIIQKTLNLESADFQRYLDCDDPPQYWPLSSAGFEDDDDETAQGNRTSAALSKYLIHGGSCPLLDEENHPNLAGP